LQNQSCDLHRISAASICRAEPLMILSWHYTGT
jgi:hypothetical protein